MKKITCILCALTLLALAAWAWARTTVVVAGSSAASAGVTYIARDTFEGAGSVLTWTDNGGTGTWDADEATTYFSGSQALHENAERRYTEFTGTDAEMYVSWAMRFNGTANLAKVYFLDSSGNELGSVECGETDASNYWCRLVHSGNGTSHSGCTGVANPINDWTLFKIVYNNGTGANGVWKLYIAETPYSTWGSPCSDISDATDTAQMGRVYINPDLYAADHYYDDIRINTTAAGGDTY